MHMGFQYFGKCSEWHAFWFNNYFGFCEEFRFIFAPDFIMKSEKAILSIITVSVLISKLVQSSLVYYSYMRLLGQTWVSMFFI